MPQIFQKVVFSNLAIINASTIINLSTIISGKENMFHKIFKLREFQYLLLFIFYLSSVTSIRTLPLTFYFGCLRFSLRAAACFRRNQGFCFGTKTSIVYSWKEMLPV